MGFRIATNVQSLSAQRNLGINNKNQQRSLEKLSSGSRIVRAADDAAGLAISEKMRSQIRSVHQNIRNANDGVSMIQTAEGAMNEVSNILVRFRELSIQAASDTVGETERQFIDKEVQQLREEIDRIAASTQFNGKRLLTGEGENLQIQVGTGNDPSKDRFYYDTSQTNVTTDALGLDGINTQSREAAQENLDRVDNAIRQLSENRAGLGALQNRLEASVRNMEIYSENLSAANSRIRDVDMAQETAELTKQNILTQAGVSVLSQANNNSTMALNLLG